MSFIQLFVHISRMPPGPLAIAFEVPGAFEARKPPAWVSYYEPLLELFKSYALSRWGAQRLERKAREMPLKALQSLCR